MCRAQAHTDTSASHLLFTCLVLYVHILHHLPAETCAVTRPRLQIAMRLPGVEPGAQAWEACMLPLHYRRSCSRDLYGSACLIFFFASSARKSFDEFVGGLPLTSCILLFVSHCQVTSNPGLCFTSICQLAVWSSGMSLAPDVRGPGFNSQNSACFFLPGNVTRSFRHQLQACLFGCLFCLSKILFGDVSLQSSSHAMLACSSAF